MSLFIQYMQVIRRSFRPGYPGPERRFSLRRIVLLLLIWPILLTLFGINAICLQLDKVLFPTFKAIRVHKPLFVVGIPRSGTTLLHRLLALNSDFTSMQLWELLFAPSILQRQCMRCLSRLDRRCGSPLRRSLDWAQARLLGDFDKIHPTGLNQPEEDYLALAPLLGCYLMILLSPADCLWALNRFDHSIPAAQRARILTYYHALVQRHLYFHGAEKTYLSKNPSFTPMLHSLIERFPDARFIACTRDPREAVPSQVSALMTGAHLLSGNAVNVSWWRDRLLAMMETYYQQLQQAQQTLPTQHFSIAPLTTIRDDAAVAIEQRLTQLNFAVPAEYQRRLLAEAPSLRRYRSAHHYDASAIGLPLTELQQRFAFAATICH